MKKVYPNARPAMATAGKVTVAEVEHLFKAGELNPDEIHGAFRDSHISRLYVQKTKWIFQCSEVLTWPFSAVLAASI